MCLAFGKISKAPAAMTAPLGFAKVLHGTEKPGHGPIYRSILEPKLVVPPDTDNPGNHLVGLTLPQADTIHHAFQQSVLDFAELPCFGWRPIVNGEAQAFEWLTYSQVRAVSSIAMGNGSHALC